VTGRERIQPFLDGKGPPPALSNEEYAELSEDERVGLYAAEDRWHRIHRPHKARYRCRFFWRQQLRGERIPLRGIGAHAPRAPVAHRIADVRSGPVRQGRPGIHGIGPDGRIVR